MCIYTIMHAIMDIVTTYNPDLERTAAEGWRRRGGALIYFTDQFFALDSVVVKD